MSSIQLPLFRRLWFKWRSLNFPWRRRRLAGMDLAGTTFWEFKDSLNANRFRRIAQFNSKTQYSDVKMSPSWHQWLRHTRLDPPSLQEQQLDIQRQSQLKYLAKLADDRWASKPSFLDAPKDTAHPEPATLPRDRGGYVGRTEPKEKEGVRTAIDNVVEVGEAGKPTKEPKKPKDNPWKIQTGNPGEKWQPEAWTPGPAKR